MKGIILAGGLGSRLYPLTLTTSKCLLPIFDKPMIYYPLATLMQCGIREILIISSPKYIDNYKNTLKDGKQWGLEISYAVQKQAKGIADAFIIGENFIQNHPCSLILGDNLFHHPNFQTKFFDHQENNFKGAKVFLCPVQDPERYGVAELDPSSKVLSVEEKPQSPKSNLAITGLYFYDNQVVNIAKNIKPSARGELEITDVNKAYLENHQLHAEIFDEQIQWFDTGTAESLLEAGNYVQEQYQRNIKIAVLEELAWELGYIQDTEVINLSKQYPNAYGEYLKKLVA